MVSSLSTTTSMHACMKKMLIMIEIDVALSRDICNAGYFLLSVDSFMIECSQVLVVVGLVCVCEVEVTSAATTSMWT